MFKKALLSLIALTLVLAFQVEKSTAGDSLLLATATTGGTYYPVGVAIGTLVSIKLAKDHQITATAINSAGSGKNIQMLKNKEAQMAILQSLYGLNAYTGKGPYAGKPMKDKCRTFWIHPVHGVYHLPL